MLNKELMMTSFSPEAHVLMTVEEVFDPVGDMDRYHAGWIEGECGSVNRIPYWKTGGENRILKGISCYWDFDLEPYETQIQKERERDYMGNAIEIEINGVKVSCNLEGTTQTVYIDGDPFSLKGSVGETLAVKFTPPQTVTFKSSIKQLFKLLEGCLDAEQGTFDDGADRAKKRTHNHLWLFLWRYFVKHYYQDWRKLESDRGCDNKRPSWYRFENRHDFITNVQHKLFKRIKQCESDCRRSTRVNNNSSNRFSAFVHYDLRQLNPFLLGGAYA